ILAPFSEVWTYSTRCRRASSASGPNARIVRSNRMSAVASVRTSRLLVSKVFLAEFSISPTTSAVITTKRLATSLTTLLVSSCRCSEGSLVLLKSPRRAAPIMDRKASTATTNSLIFFSFHVIEICDGIVRASARLPPMRATDPAGWGLSTRLAPSPQGGPSSPQPSKPQRDPALLVALLARLQSNRAGLQQIEGAPAQGCAHTSLLVFVLVIPPRPLPSWCACRPKENKQTGATALKEARSHAEQMTSRQTMLRIAVVAMPFRSSRETRTGRARRGLARSRGRRGRRCSACLLSSTCR